MYYWPLLTIDGQGKHKGCQCNPEDKVIVDSDDSKAQKVIDAAIAAIKKPKPKPEPKVECPGDPSAVPSKFFLDQTSKDFCKTVMEDLKQSRGSGLSVYDIKGNKIPNLRRRGGSVIERSPPENIDNYGNYRISLGYDPKDGECLVDKEDLCRNAYKTLVQSNCMCRKPPPESLIGHVRGRAGILTRGTTGGQNHGSAGDRLFEDASVDVGCGKFSWSVIDTTKKKDPAPPKIELGKRECHDSHNHKDVQPEAQQSYADMACGSMTKDDKTLKAGDKPLFYGPPGAFGNSWILSYQISWIEGCDKVKEQNTKFPLKDDHDVTCTSLMKGNYKECKSDIHEPHGPRS